MRHGLERRRLRFAALVARLHKAHPMARTSERRAALAALEARLERAMTTRLQRQTTRISALQRALVALSPVAVLGRGYAIVQRLPGLDVIRSGGDVGPGDRIAVRVATGAFEARVEENQ
jgi:exodeoxyribonuclease VII large subunit